MPKADWASRQRVINFPALQHLRKLRFALEHGYAERLVGIAPNLPATLRIALSLHELNLEEVDILGRPLTGLCDKIAPITDEKGGEWGLKPGVSPIELVCNIEALIMAVNEVRRD